MLQRHFNFLFFLVMLLITWQGNAQTPKPGKAKRPNIIFILADDLGIGDLGCYGQQRIATPNIDRLAKQGMQFSQVYAGTAVCAPSRASFLTGLHTGHTPVRGNLGFKPEGQYPLPDSSLTIATVLEKAGYTTGDFGKWGLGYPGSTGMPTKKGFDVFYGYNCQTLAHNYYPDHLWQNDTKVELTANASKDSIYSADLIHRKAIQFIRQYHQQPFFLFLSYTLPHAELSVPHDSVYEYYVRLFHDLPLVETANTPKNKESRVFEPYPRAAYAAMVSRLDKYVGEVMAALRKQGIANNTLVVFSSDNGPHKEGGNDPAYFNSSGIYRGIKRDLYEGGIREPFIAVWPGKIKPGTKNNFVGAFWDLFPTFQEVAGLKPSIYIDGISLLPTLTGHNTLQKEHGFLYWEFHEQGGKQAIRVGNWKGVKTNVSTQADPPLELYDLEKDPGEKNDIAGQYPTLVEELNQLIQRSHIYNKDWPLLLSEKKQ